MLSPATLLVGATALLYTLAAVLHLLAFVRRDVERWAGWLTRSGWITQTGALLLLGAAGRLRLASLLDFTLLFCWLLMSAYVGLSLWMRSEAAGSFVLPVVAGALVLALGVAEHVGLVRGVSGGFLLWHVGVALIAYACLFVASVAGALYLVQEANLRRKRWGRIYYRMPSLEDLDNWAVRFAWMGHPLLTLTIISGLIQAHGIWLFSDPKIWVTAVLWLLWGGYLLMRHLRGWGGRRAAWLSLAGLVGILANWFLINMLSAGHRFGL
jgi:ABC-type uncharacterized transport system permease subunit